MILVMKQHLMRKVSGGEGRGEMRKREGSAGRGREEVIMYKEGERTDWEEKGGERKEGGRGIGSQRGGISYTAQQEIREGTEGHKREGGGKGEVMKNNKI